MNAVYLEMVKLGKKWNQEIKKNPEAISFVLLGQKPQNQLFETYFKYQLSEESKTNDTYLIYYQPFDDGKKYSASLLEELKYVYKQWQEQTPGTADWADHQQSDESGPGFYVNSILDFLEQYPVLKENKIFIHLAPTAVSDSKAYEAWITECGRMIESARAADFIKLVFTDHESYRTVRNFYKPHFWDFPIDISKLMEKTAEGTNKRKGAKENNFQQLILKAGNFLGKQKFDDAGIMLDQAIKVATENRYNQGTILAKMLKAQNYQAQEKNAEAGALYEQAVKDANNDEDILVQVYFSYAGFLLSQKEKTKALDLFEKVGKIGEKKNDLVLQIEANRLIGQLSDSKFSGRKAAGYYERCIELGRQVPAKELTETSLPYIATLLMKKYGEGSEKGEALNDTMTRLFGKDWKALVIIPDLKKNKSY